jgi:3-methyl-2-oxobutanoate hydroxymethyltransferase
MNDDVAAPYGTGPAKTGSAAVKRVRTHHLRRLKEDGERFSMLTTYDQYSAETFDEAGIDVLLVGDSAANNVYGYETTVPITVDELLPLTRAVSRSVHRALVVGDLPFGSYQASPEQAYMTAARFMKEGLAHCVKLEGGVEMTPQISRLSQGGIPVMAHIGFTPQSEHALGGYRVQGRGETAERVLSDAHAVQDAGAFAVVMEMVPGDVAAQVTKELVIPTIGIGAGAECDGQVLVWTDAFGMRPGKMARFVKQYADLRGELLRAARAYDDDVKNRTFPDPDHTF